MQVICEILFGVPTVSTLPWALITMVVLVLAYAIAMVVPNIWPVMVSLQAHNHVYIIMCYNTNTE